MRFGVVEVDGHSVDQLRDVLTSLPVEADKPTAVICHTVKGKGAECIERNLEWHHKSRITDGEIETLLRALGEETDAQDLP